MPSQKPSSLFSVSVEAPPSAAREMNRIDGELALAGLDKQWQTLFGLAMGLVAGEHGFQAAAALDVRDLPAGAFRDACEALFEQLRARVGAVRASELASDMLAAVRASDVSATVR